MIDEAEEASKTTEIFTLAAAKRLADVCKRKPSGKCFNCGEKVKKPRRWCDASCRDEWEKVRAKR